jgi:hypothetical protein
VTSEGKIHAAPDLNQPLRANAKERILGDGVVIMQRQVMVQHRVVLFRTCCRARPW